MCCENQNNNTCSTDILETILMLQQRSEQCDDNSCSRPFLGPANNLICLNTRPISFYSCCNNTLWEMPYTLNGETSTSSVFRIENIDNNVATFRVLAPNTDPKSTFPYLATNDFFTIKINCIGIMRCLGDTTVSGL